MTQNYYFSANQNAKRLHGVPKWFSLDVQSPSHRVSHTMTNKSKQKKKVTFTKPKQKKATPFADAGAIVGSKVSTMFNAPWAKGVGKWLGSGIGQIFGSGDYTMMGEAPSYNVLTNGNQIPKFQTTSQTNVICHREYLGDISGTSSFNLAQYPINPGMSRTFPWLSSIAQNYQQYKIHGLIFEFRSLLTDFVTGGQPGVIVMATNYNADASSYTTKQEMENSEYAVSVKPTRDLIHGVECASNQTVLNQLYVRSGAPPTGQDLRLYDLGNYQIATQNNPVATSVGELWVSYCVEFFKPILPTDVGGNVLSNHIIRSSISSANPLGLVGVQNKGDLPLTVSAFTLSGFVNQGNYYLVTLSWTGSVAAACVYPTMTPSGAALVPFWVNGAATSITTPGAGTSTTSMSMQFVLQATETYLSLLFSVGSGTFPGGTTSLDIAFTTFSTEAI